ncbi:hypothetical protein JST97_26800 [bacterium]|nr:hypothetical protein [bacterium]
MRADFRGLTPEALAAMANWGLVKRAQREPAPELLLEEGGLRALFADGNRCFFPDAQPATQGHCSCAAAGWCRHLIGALLACAGSEPKPQPAEFVAVDMGRVEKLLGKRLWTKALAEKARGLSAEVLGPPWQVRLPGCTVRFLLGSDVDYGKCDCQLKGPCLHLALAAWAFNQQAGQPGRVLWQGSSQPTALDQTELWLEQLLEAGVAGSAALWEVWGSRVRAEIFGCSWLRVLVEEILQLGQAYAQAASHYSSGRWLYCLLSLALRLRDGSSYLLGRDVAWEQELEHSRLFALGCRRRAQDVQLFWADESGQVLVQLLPAGSESVPALGRLSEAAGSQVVSRGLVRRADGSLRFRRECNRHSLTRLGLDWRDLPAPLIWPGREAWARRCNERPSRLLEAPLLARDLWVVPLSGVQTGFYDPGSQRLVARIDDLHRGQLELRRTHQRECPGALDALAWALPQAVWLTGFVRLEGGIPRLEPVAIATNEQLVVLDLYQGAEPFDWPLALESSGRDGLSEMLQEALSLCQQAAQMGLSQLVPSFQRRRQELAERLREGSMLNLSRALASDWDFRGAAVRCFLATERLNG